MHGRRFHQLDLTQNKNTGGYYGKVKGWFLKKYDNYQELVNGKEEESGEAEAQAPASEATAA